MTYTINELLSMAMSQMGEASKYRKDYEPYVVDLVNRLLSDCFDINNGIREGAGKEPFAAVPVLADADAEVPYEYDVVSPMMVFGLAYWCLFQDEEYTKASAMQREYENNKNRFARASYESVVDLLWP